MNGVLTQITIDVAGWQDAFATLGPFLGVAALLAVWQIYVVKKFTNKKLRIRLQCGSSVVIIIACTLALVVGFLNSQ